VAGPRAHSCEWSQFTWWLGPGLIAVSGLSSPGGWAQGSYVAVSGLSSPGGWAQGSLLLVASWLGPGLMVSVHLVAGARAHSCEWSAMSGLSTA
jgi:hypothetical protein